MGLVGLVMGGLMVAAAGTTAAYWIGAKAAGAGKAGDVVGRPVEPPGTAAAPVAPADVVHADVYFDFKSTRLTADAVRLLQEKVGLMDHDGTWTVLLQGYADRQGPPEYNKQLARRRAESVKQFLVELGVPDTAVRIVAVGPEGALCEDPGRECQRLNRRVHLEMRKLARAAAATPVRAVIADGDELDTGGGTVDPR
jgi:outer membrane protein OmpA-like peptidoglycan-associated protein